MKKVNYEKIKNKREQENDKIFKILKTICVFGVVIVLIEFLYLGFLMITRNKDINIDLGQRIVDLNDGYVIVGSSNFDKSELNDKSEEESGKVSVYDNNDKLVKEFKYDKKYKSVFYDVVEINDGYIVVGTCIENKENEKEALIVKFDKDGKVIWENTYTELDESNFKSLLVDGEYIIAVGSSVYESDVIGNEDKGGAIIVKYDLSGKEIKSNHFGNNKAGSFNDLIKVNDLYYAVGSDTSDDALLLGFNSELEKKAVVNYSDTNRSGFTSILNFNNNLYVTCSKVFEKEDNILEKATIVIYSYSLEKINEVTYEDEDYSIWNEIISYNNELYLVGDSAKKEGEYGSMFVDYLYKGIVSKYSSDLKMEWFNEYEYENNDYYKSLIIKNNKIYTVGYTNSKFKKLKSNKYNYVTLVNKYSLDGK